MREKLSNVLVSFVLTMLLFVVMSPIRVSIGVMGFDGESEDFVVQSGVDWWSMFHHDLSHTGYSTSKAPNTNNTIWIYPTHGGVYSSPAVAYGKVYVGSMDNKTYCLDASTGTHIWNYTTGYWVVHSSPAVVDDKVYIGSCDCKVYCLNATTGTHIWNYTTGHYVRSSPAVADGKVYVGSGDYNVYCLDASTGTRIWNYTTGSSVYSSPAVADGKVYVGWYSGHVIAFGPTHDVAVTNVAPSKTVVGQNCSMSVNVTVENQGDFTETFDVTTYYNTTTIETKTVTNLPLGENTTLTFTWNTTGVAKGNYTITAYAHPVLNETDTTDNTYVDGTIQIITPPYGPTASFTTLPTTAKADETIKLNASSSLAGWNGTHTKPITEYRWDFDDGNKTTTATPIIYHSYKTAGNYYVTLTVYAPDATPETDSTTNKVTVISIPVGGTTVTIQSKPSSSSITPILLILSIAVASIIHRKHKKPSHK